MAKRKLKINAHQKPSTLKPGIQWLANNVMQAFITNRNKPSEKMVTGRVSRTRAGRTVLLSNASNRATQIAVMVSFTEIPVNK